MKKRLLFLLMMFPVIALGQVIDLDKTYIDSTWQSIVVDSIIFENGATISNKETDTLVLIEPVVKIEGDLYATGFIITDEDVMGMSVVSTPGQMTITTGGTFEKLFEGAIAYTGTHLANFTESNGRLTYTGAPDMMITVQVTMNIEADEAAQLIQLQIALNGTPIALSNMQADFGAVDTDDIIPMHWLLELSTDDYIEIYGTSDQDGDQFTVHGGVFTVERH